MPEIVVAYTTVSIPKQLERKLARKMGRSAFKTTSERVLFLVRREVTTTEPGSGE